MAAMSENGQTARGRHAHNATHDTRSPHLLPGAQSARREVRRPLFRRGLVDAHLLPPGVHRQAAEARELPLLSERGGRGVGRLPAVPALPARARAGQRERGCDDAPRPGRREHDGRPHAGQGRAGHARRAPRHHRPPPAPRFRRRVRRLAGGVRADAAAAAREASADRHRAAGHRGGVRERLRQRAAFQRALQAALSPADPADCAAQRACAARQPLQSTRSSSS